MTRLRYPFIASSDCTIGSGMVCMLWRSRHSVAAGKLGLATVIPFAVGRVHLDGNPTQDAYPALAQESRQLADHLRCGRDLEPRIGRKQGSSGLCFDDELDRECRGLLGAGM